jgi:hypothetical protein
MQYTRNIRGRYYNGIRGSLVGGASKIAFFIPVRIPLGFNFSRYIIFAEFHIFWHSALIANPPKKV